MQIVMATIEVIMNKIYQRFADLNFVEVDSGILPNSSPEIQDNEKIFRMGMLFCRPQYLSSMGFLIEYAHDLFEAENNLYGDGDNFPLSLGETEILEGITNELMEAISDLDYSTVPLVAELKVAV